MIVTLNQVEIEVSGQPIGKGRPRFTKAGHAYTPTKTREYEKRIQAAAWSKMQEMKLKPTGRFCHVKVVAFMDIPKSRHFLLLSCIAQSFDLSHNAW